MTQSPHWPEHRPEPDNKAFAADPALLASVFAASRDCIKVFDANGNLLFMNEAGQRVLEIGDFEVLRLCPWDQFWLGENPDAIAALATAQAGGTGRFSAKRPSFAGSTRFWEVEISPIAGSDGRLLAISRDITEQWLARQALEAESAERNHRIKNQMAVIQSIVNQTLRGAYPVETAKKMIAARLDVLARTHDLLMHSPGERTSVPALVDAATMLLDRRRLSLSGPDMPIGPKAALSLALLLHELSTNAMAHGAFSVPDGRADIIWHEGDMDGEPAFELHFKESGGPPVSPPAVKGFGSRLLQGGLSGSASRAVLDFHPDGVRFRLVAALANLQSEG
ncbi:MAG TPA: HWE histidine kinase domain-containing protein [Ramlibacter sp.]|jgi:PAS domain S-box-containing protein